jgi:hypothetical protein
VVSSTTRPHFSSGKDPGPILQEVVAGVEGRIISSPPGFDPGQFGGGAQSLYRLSYRAHVINNELRRNNDLKIKDYAWKTED